MTWMRNYIPQNICINYLSNPRHTQSLLLKEAIEAWKWFSSLATKPYVSRELHHERLDK